MIRVRRAYNKFNVGRVLRVVLVFAKVAFLSEGDTG
jgi:hypothetical protein